MREPSERPFSMIGVPIDCGGRPGGTELAPDILRARGLASALGAVSDLGNMDVRMRGTERDQDTGIIAFPSLVEITGDVRRKTAEIINSGRRPFLVGGCCSFMMGAIAAASDCIGNVGLAYIDGHMDLYDGKTSPGGEAADMPLALMLGHSVPQDLASAAGGTSRINVGNVALLGYRDRVLAIEAGSLLPENIEGDFYFRDSASIKESGGIAVGREVRERLESRTDGFWVHVDIDVLDEEVFPAVDYLMPDGLDFGQLGALLTPLVSSPKVMGMSIACYNPELDPDSTCAIRVVEFFKALFSFTSSGSVEG